LIGLVGWLPEQSDIEVGGAGGGDRNAALGEGVVEILGGEEIVGVATGD
jgi:hypothetical protein